MPLKNAFGTPSCGRASANLRSGKLPVSWGQQPKPQIMFLWFIYICFETFRLTDFVLSLSSKIAKHFLAKNQTSFATAKVVWNAKLCPLTSPDKIMAISPLAGKPAPKAMLVDLARLERDYYGRQPDMADPNQLVSFGTSGHRGSSLNGTFTEAHILAITQAICDLDTAARDTAVQTAEKRRRAARQKSPPEQSTDISKLWRQDSRHSYLISGEAGDTLVAGAPAGAVTELVCATLRRLSGSSCKDRGCE
jgi:hypothetical protein